MEIFTRKKGNVSTDKISDETRKEIENNTESMIESHFC